MKQPAQPKVSGREARRRLNTLQIQTEEAVIPGIGLLVQSQAEQEQRIDALEAWAKDARLAHYRFIDRGFWERVGWMLFGE